MSSASFNSLFFNWADHIQRLVFVFQWVTNGFDTDVLSSFFAFPLLIPVKPRKKRVPHYRHSGNYLVNNMGENSHHSLLLGFCFNLVLCVERDRINVKSYHADLSGKTTTAWLWFLLVLFLTNNLLKNSEHILTRRWRSSKSPAVASKKKKKRLVLSSPTEYCRPIRFEMLWLSVAPSASFMKETSSN